MLTSHTFHRNQVTRIWRGSLAITTLYRLRWGEGSGKTLLYPQQDSCVTNEIVQLPVDHVFTGGQVILAEDVAAGISCHVRVTSCSVVCREARPPTRSAALPVAGVWKHTGVCCKPKENQEFNAGIWGGCPMNFINFVRSVCNEYKTRQWYVFTSCLKR